MFPQETSSGDQPTNVCDQAPPSQPQPPRITLLLFLAESRPIQLDDSAQGFDAEAAWRDNPYPAW